MQALIDNSFGFPLPQLPKPTPAKTDLGRLRKPGNSNRQAALGMACFLRLHLQNLPQRGRIRNHILHIRTSCPVSPFVVFSIESCTSIPSTLALSAHFPVSAVYELFRFSRILTVSAESAYLITRSHQYSSPLQRSPRIISKQPVCDLSLISSPILFSKVRKGHFN